MLARRKLQVARIRGLCPSLSLPAEFFGGVLFFNCKKILLVCVDDYDKTGVPFSPCLLT